MEQRKLFIDLSFFIVFAIVLAYVVTIHETKAAYYSTEVVRNLVVNGHYTKTIPFTSVTSYRE